MTIPAESRFPGAVIYENFNVGYPYRGARRRMSARLLGCTHITGNSSLPSALAEVKYSSRSGSGASFAFCVNRNGSVVQAFDPFRYAGWANGDLNNPDMSNPVIASLVGSVYNPNEFCLLAIENVGFEPGNPLTDAQIETNAQLYAWAASALHWGTIGPNDIIGHRQINNVTRHNCPTSGDLNALKNKIISRANAILGGGQVNKIIDIARFGEERRWETRSYGVVEAFDGKSSKITKQMTIGAGSGANAIAVVRMEGDDVPSYKRYIEVTNGAFEGLYVPMKYVNIDVSPSTSTPSDDDLNNAKKQGQKQGASAILDAAKTAAAQFGVS